MLGVACVAALSVSFTSLAEDIDNRPIYYVMLKSLENGFKSYNDELVSALEDGDSRLRAQYRPLREEVAAAFEKLEAERERKVSTFNSERDALNERIAELNEQIALRDGRAGEARRIESRYADDPRVASLTDAVAAERARIDALRDEYLAELEATQKARAELTRQFEEYTTAGDPLALEIRSLEQDWQRFAESERKKLKNLADAYADGYADYNAWLEREGAALEELRAAVENAVETDREQRALHARLEAQLRALIDEYNALVEVHNAAGSGDPGRDERAARFAALEKRIATLQSDLARARETVLKVGEEYLENKRLYDDRYERFLDEKRDREARLAGDLADINAARVAVEADIEARRRNAEQQIKALEAQISGELEGARRKLETLNRRLVENFGQDHEGLDVAIEQFLENDDDSLLYTARGAPRFDLSRPKTAAVYRSVERLLADRRSIDARIVALQERGGGSQRAAGDEREPSGALERERAALSAERQQLLEAHASFAREHQSRAAQLEQRLRDIDARLADDRARLKELFSIRANVTRLEFQLVQQVLVAAVTGRPSESIDPGEYERLLSALTEKAKRMGASAPASMEDPYALLEHIAEGVPRDVAPHSGWQSFTRDDVTGSRTLTGREKAMVAIAWLARYRSQPRFDAIAEQLDDTGAVASGGEALATLFLDGAINHMTIDEQRLEGDAVGIRVGVLGRAYALEPDGSLARLPGG